MSSNYCFGRNTKRNPRLSVCLENGTLFLIYSEVTNMKFYYPAVITENENGTYHADFPDLALCEADGDSMDEVLEKSIEAMYTWIDSELHEDDPKLPAATDRADLEEGLKAGQCVRQILVNYKMMEGWEE